MILQYSGGGALSARFGYGGNERVGMRSKKWSGDSEWESELGTEYKGVGKLDGSWLSIVGASRMGR